eukprot:1156168-Pelagomonas_calceolata.AAC.9
MARWAVAASRVGKGLVSGQNLSPTRAHKDSVGAALVLDRGASRENPVRESSGYVFRNFSALFQESFIPAGAGVYHPMTLTKSGKTASGRLEAITLITRVCYIMQIRALAMPSGTYPVSQPNETHNLPIPHRDPLQSETCSTFKKEY